MGLPLNVLLAQHLKKLMRFFYQETTYSFDDEQLSLRRRGKNFHSCIFFVLRKQKPHPFSIRIDCYAFSSIKHFLFLHIDGWTITISIENSQFSWISFRFCFVFFFAVVIVSLISRVRWIVKIIDINRLLLVECTTKTQLCCRKTFMAFVSLPFQLHALWYNENTLGNKVEQIVLLSWIQSNMIFVHLRHGVFLLLSLMLVLV